MTPLAFDIASRYRDDPLSFVQPVDFTLGAGVPVTAAFVRDHRHLSLYCLDHEQRRALFVELPPGADPYAAPFLYQAQFAHAHRVVAVPYPVLHALADEVEVDDGRLALIYSVGRCGSTLVSRAFHAVDTVVGLSEPDVHTQILRLRNEGAPPDEVVALTRSCTRLLCHHASLSTGRMHHVLKLRGFCVELCDVLAEVVPDARIVFMYRGAAGWLRSAGRTFGFLHPDAAGNMAEIQAFFAGMSPRVAAFGRKHARTISPIELLACIWVSILDRGLALRRGGRPVLSVRYEDLAHAPRDTLDAVFRFCGVEVTDPDALGAALDDLLARDAQAGTTVARDEPGDTVTDDHVAEMLAFLRADAPDVPPDVVVPGSYVPSAAVAATSSQRSAPHAG